MSRLRALLRTRDTGASAVEYGLVVVAIAAAVIVIVFLLGDTVNAVFTQSCDTIEGQTATGVDCTP